MRVEAGSKRKRRTLPFFSPSTTRISLNMSLPRNIVGATLSSLEIEQNGEPDVAATADTGRGRYLRRNPPRNALRNQPLSHRQPVDSASTIDQ
jgi:hypothetical protein